MPGWNFAAHHGVPIVAPRRYPVVAPVAVPVAVRPTPGATWKFTVLLDKKQVLAQVPSKSLGDTQALLVMADLARQWAYDPSTQGKGVTVTVNGMRWNGSTWLLFSTEASVSKQK